MPAKNTAPLLAEHIELGPEDVSEYIHRLTSATMEELDLDQSDNPDQLSWLLSEEESIKETRTLTRDQIRGIFRSTNIEAQLPKIQEKLGPNVSIAEFDDARYHFVSSKVTVTKSEPQLRKIKALHEKVAEASQKGLSVATRVVLRALCNQYFGVSLADIEQILRDHKIPFPNLKEAFREINEKILQDSEARILVRHGIVIIGDKNEEILLPELTKDSEKTNIEAAKEEAQKALTTNAINPETLAGKILEHFIGLPDLQMGRTEFETWYFSTLKESQTPPATTLRNLRKKLESQTNLTIVSDPSDAPYEKDNCKDKDILKLRIAPSRISEDPEEKDLLDADAIHQPKTALDTLGDEETKPPQPELTSPATEQDIEFLLENIHGHKDSTPIIKAFLQFFLEAIKGSRTVQRKDLNAVHSTLPVTYQFSASLTNLRQSLESQGYRLVETAANAKKATRYARYKDSNILTIVRIVKPGESAPSPQPQPESPETATLVRQLAEFQADADQMIQNGLSTQAELEALSQQLAETTEVITLLTELLAEKAVMADANTESREHAEDLHDKYTEDTATFVEEMRTLLKSLALEKGTNTALTQRVQRLLQSLKTIWTALAQTKEHAQALAEQHTRDLATIDELSARPAPAAETSDPETVNLTVDGLRSIGDSIKKLQDLVERLQAELAQKPLFEKPKDPPPISSMDELRSEVAKLREKHLSNKPEVSGATFEVSGATLIQILVELQSLAKRAAKVDTGGKLQDFILIVAGELAGGRPLKGPQIVVLTRHLTIPESKTPGTPLAIDSIADLSAEVMDILGPLKGISLRCKDVVTALDKIGELTSPIPSVNKALNEFKKICKRHKESLGSPERINGAVLRRELRDLFTYEFKETRRDEEEE